MTRLRQGEARPAPGPLLGDTFLLLIHAGRKPANLVPPSPWSRAMTHTHEAVIWFTSTEVVYGVTDPDVTG